MSAIDADVRAEVYRFFVADGRAPVAAEVAERLGTDQYAVEESYRRLADSHMLVLAPGTPHIWMANPFSALPTAYPVEAGGRTWFGNCIWDALGILALLDRDGVVSTRCADCGERMTVRVNDGELVTSEGVVHYAIPAARWWDDIGFN